MRTVPEEVSHAVDRLLEEIGTAPTRLPLAEIAALQRTGHDVSVRVGDPAVVFVQRRADERLSGLTTREHDVARLAARGYRNQEIASALWISVSTVKDHMHSILTKAELVSRSQLIAAWYGGLAVPSAGLGSDVNVDLP